MHIVNREQALNFLRQRGVPAPVRRALGDYSEDDPNVYNSPVYNQDRTFYAPGGTQGGVQLVQPTLYQNVTSYSVYPFVIANASQQILPANSKRQYLLVQNVASSAANLWVNFTSGASIGNGILLAQDQGIIFDFACPNNSVNCYYDNGTPLAGVAIEGAPTL